MYLTKADLRIPTVPFLIVFHKQKWVVIKVTEKFDFRPALMINVSSKDRHEVCRNSLYTPIVFVFLKKFMFVEKLYKPE